MRLYLTIQHMIEKVIDGGVAQVERGAGAQTSASVSPQPEQHAGPGRSDSGRLLPIYGINLVGLSGALRYYVSHSIHYLV